MAEHDLEQAAIDPLKASADGESFEQHPLADQIEFDKHKERKKAAARRGLPLFIGKLRPPGAV